MISKSHLCIAAIFVLLNPFTGCSQKSNLSAGNVDGRRSEKFKVLDSVGVLPFSILQYDVKIRTSDPQTKAYSFITFYDAANQELLTYRSGVIASIAYQASGNYTEAPPFTSYVKIGIETDSLSTGQVYSDSLNVKLNIGKPASYKLPLCNLDQYMIPFWQSDTIYNETVLMYAQSGAPAAGSLIFIPDKIISVKKFDLTTTFTAGSDYTLQGKMLTRTVHSGMPYRTDVSFDGNDLAWFDLQSQWVVVTYTHHDIWDGPVPVYKADKLPSLAARFRARSPVKIIAYGMSITRGLDVSSYDDVAPFMPTYLDLMVRQLRINYGYDQIEGINAGLPGALVSWAAMYAGQYISPVKPDLVIIDFGMNDFWRYTPLEFKVYIQTIMAKIKDSVPAAEFLLISNMDFDPAYILDADKNKSFYTTNMQGYKDVLREMETTGVVNLDMTTLSDEIYRRKKAKDCIANPLHPNDYLARWYAQGLVAILFQ